MFKPTMIENEKNLHCQMKHELPVSMVILDSKLTQNQRLLCQQCIDNYESDQNKTIGFKKVVQKIEENKQQLLNMIENLITINIKQVESFQDHIINLKSIILQQLDQLINNTKDWIFNLKSIGSKYQEYSFFKELDLIIINQQSTQQDQINCQNQIQILNHSWITKVNSKLKQFKSFQEYQSLNNILNNLNESTSNILQQQQQLTPNKLLSINDKVEQKEDCRSIVFDPTGKIMVSTSNNKIVIWNFDNGKIQQVHSLSQHQEDVRRLVYSQIRNCFISGSFDGSIRLWKQLNNNQWESSKPQCEHKECIYCMILTQKEDQLISGSEDTTIKVWKVDFINNKLTFLYSLQKHASCVTSLSLNLSERVLVSCGYDKLIIIWLKDANEQWKFQQIVIVVKNVKFEDDVIYQLKKGYIQLFHFIQIVLMICNYNKQSIQEIGSDVKFLKEDQFIWLPCSSNILCVYEYKDNQYQEIIDKRVQFKKLIRNIIKLNGFPIIYIKDKNLICLKHQLHILLLKVQNDGQLSIVQELDCQDRNICGTVTNNGQYLIFWGSIKGKYEIYEIQYI